MAKFLDETGLSKLAEIVNDLVSGVDTLSYNSNFIESTAGLPNPSSSTQGQIYLHKDNNQKVHRYVTTRNGLNNYVWADLGETDDDWTNYYTKAEVDAMKSDDGSTVFNSHSVVPTGYAVDAEFARKNGNSTQNFSADTLTANSVKNPTSGSYAISIPVSSASGQSLVLSGGTYQGLTCGSALDAAVVGEVVETVD